jgi:AcrR family transcriptional regulator
MSTTETRARGELHRAARRATLLAAAARSFDRHGFDATTMAGVAATAGVSKGATYLYFPSKESLFRKLLLLDLAAWAATVEGRLDGSRSRSARGVARALAAELAARPRLLRLLTLLHPVLAPRADAEAGVVFERALAAALRPLAARLEERLPDLRRGEGARLLARLRALAVGLAPLAESRPELAAAATTEPDLAPLGADFERELTDCLTALIDGWR